MSEAFRLDSHTTSHTSEAFVLDDIGAAQADATSVDLLVTEFVFVPEPSAGVLMCLGLLGAIGWRRR